MKIPPLLLVVVYQQEIDRIFLLFKKRLVGREGCL